MSQVSALIGRSPRDGVRTGSDTRRTARTLVTLALILYCVLASGEPVADKHYRVLVLHSFRNSLPVNTDWYSGIVRGFASAPDLRVDFDIEALDLTRFSDPGYIADLLEVYRRKYLGNSPDLIIPTYTPALQFLLDHGQDLFPGVPAVFCDADSRFVRARAIPQNVTDITSLADIAGTAELALRLHPHVRRMAVIVGSHALDKLFERRARQDLRPFEGRVGLTWLRGMPFEELLAATRRLPRDTLFRDKRGHGHGARNFPNNYRRTWGAALVRA